MTEHFICAPGDEAEALRLSSIDHVIELAMDLFPDHFKTASQSMALASNERIKTIMNIVMKAALHNYIKELWDSVMEVMKEERQRISTEFGVTFSPNIDEHVATLRTRVTAHPKMSSMITTLLTVATAHGILEEIPAGIVGCVSLVSCLKLIRKAKGDATVDKLVEELAEFIAATPASDTKQ